MYGYTRTNLLPKDIAKVINKEPLNLPSGPLNPIDKLMVERIYDYYAQRGYIYKYITNWKGTDVNDPKLKEIEGTYKKHLGRPASDPLLSAQIPAARTRRLRHEQWTSLVQQSLGGWLCQSRKAATRIS